MRAPLKLNRKHWPAMLTGILPAMDDPREIYTLPNDESAFTRAVSTLKFGKTFKTTQKARYPMSIELLATAYANVTPPVILDIGASDGTTSMDVMSKVPFSTYIAADLNVEVRYLVRQEGTYFYDCEGACIMFAADRWVVYPDTGDAIPPFGSIADGFFKSVPAADSTLGSITLINPRLRAKNDERVRFVKHNIFEPWPHQQPGLIIAANILNRSYFSDEQIQDAVRLLRKALASDGRLAIIDNRDIEKSTIFKFNAGVASIENKVNGGSEIEDLVVKTFA